MVTRALDPTGRGRARCVTRCKPALNAFAITFEGRTVPSSNNPSAMAGYTVSPTVRPRYAEQRIMSDADTIVYGVAVPRAPRTGCGVGGARRDTEGCR